MRNRTAMMTSAFAGRSRVVRTPVSVSSEASSSEASRCLGLFSHTLRFLSKGSEAIQRVANFLQPLRCQVDSCFITMLRWGQGRLQEVQRRRVSVCLGELIRLRGNAKGAVLSSISRTGIPSLRKRRWLHLLLKIKRNVTGTGRSLQYFLISI